MDYGKFNQIYIQLTRHAESLHQTHHTQWFIFGTGKTDFRGHDFTVQAVLALFAVTTITKFSSDGSFLQLSCHHAVTIVAQYTPTNCNPR